MPTDERSMFLVRGNRSPDAKFVNKKMFQNNKKDRLGVN